MKDHEGCIRGYHRSSKGWYGASKDEIEIGFGMFHPDGGTSGEMRIVWIELNNVLCARLMCFEDSWSALSLFPDLIQKMGEVDEEEIQEEDFAKILDSCGFKDLTQYKSPYKDVEIPESDMVTLKIPKAKAEKLGLLKVQ
jgi:hypothetical protein